MPLLQIQVSFLGSSSCEAVEILEHILIAGANKAIFLKIINYVK